MPKVFISYSYQDEEWKKRLQKHLSVLEMEGLLSVWEDRQIAEGDVWYPAIEQALSEADVAILLISVDLLTSRFIRGEEIPRLLKRREDEGIRVIPLILKPCPWRKVEWLSALQGATRDNVELSGLSKHGQEKALSQLAKRVHELLSVGKQSQQSDPKRGKTQRKPIKIDRLPIVAGEFFGREAELNLLDDALAAGPRAAVRILSGPAGEGAARHPGGDAVPVQRGAPCLCGGVASGA